MTRPPVDPARGAEVARELRALGVKGTLIKAAELGYVRAVVARLLGRSPGNATVANRATSEERTAR